MLDEFGRVFVGTFNQNIQIMDVQSHNHIKTLTGHIGTVTCLCTTPCGQFMFSASVDTTVQVSVPLVCVCLSLISNMYHRYGVWTRCYQFKHCKDMKKQSMH